MGPAFFVVSFQWEVFRFQQERGFLKPHQVLGGPRLLATMGHPADTYPLTEKQNTSH